MSLRAFDSGDVQKDRNIEQDENVSAGTNKLHGVTLILQLVAGDYVFLEGQQNTGGALNALGGAATVDATMVSCWRLGP